MEDPFFLAPFDTDKFRTGIIEEYKTILRPLVHQPVTLLEIGVFKGGSMMYWDSYLKHQGSRIVGIDLSVPRLEVSDRVFLHVCDQNDREGLLPIARTYQQFDLIIDDGSHRRRETQTCFEALYPFLKAGGYYVIEDWAVGYYEKSFPQFEGMIKMITDLMEQYWDWGFESYRIVREPGKAIAFFQKGTGKHPES